jgi:hypothetical protein
LPTEPGVLKQGTRPRKLVSGGSSPPPGSVASSQCQTSAPRAPCAPRGESLWNVRIRRPKASGVPRRPKAKAPEGDKPWWSQTGSNRRPQACKASALPTELWPLPVTSEQSPATRGKVDGRGTAEPGRAPRARRARKPEGLASPTGRRRRCAGPRPRWWAWDDSNVRPHPYQGCALTS